MPRRIKWTAVTAVCLVLVLSGCAPGSNGVDGPVTTFPTATLHPVFSSGTEFGDRLSETRAAESTEEALDIPTRTPPPTPSDPPPVLAAATTSSSSSAAGPTATISGETIELPILLYHHISSPESGSAASGYEYYVSPETFEAHMTYLADNGYTPIDLYTLYESLNDTADLPSNPVAITFDDGYTDLYENAFPILQDFGFTATFFIITDFIENSREGYMTWEMIEEMAVTGMRFETHSSTHADLRGQNNDFLIRQVLDSQEILAQHLGYTPRFIAYPFGQYDDNLIQFLTETGFWGGLTAQGGLEVGLGNRFTWPRLYIPADTPVETFATTLVEGQSGSYQPELVEASTTAAPLTTTISLSTTQGTITTSALLLFDETLHPDWTVRTSPGVEFAVEERAEAFSGTMALSYSPGEDFGSFFLQVRPDTTSPYLRDEIEGVAFRLYTGSEALATDDLALIITGSNDFPYWSAVDESVELEEFEPAFDDGRFELGFNRSISAETWVQVVLFFDDLTYDTDYQYITGLNFVNNSGITRPFLIDELVLILRET